MPIQPVAVEFDTQRIVPYFQPIMDLNTDNVWSYECLARLLDDNDNLFLPSDFLSLVEQQDNTSELTRHVFLRSAEFFRRHSVPFSINLAKEDIQQPHLLPFLEEVLADYPNPGRVQLEVSADLASECLPQLTELLAQLQSLKVGIMLDHFGVHDEHESLLELPVSGVKFDGRLIRQLVIDEGRQARVKKLLDQAHWMGMIAVAEHIEDALTLETVEELGFHYGQGFYFSLPQANPSDS
ncbi:Cyclic di-GMP phosphodiesterase CdpA [Saliniradius amylolyticus]|uniref:Cyclic di-GMP phosphodiesterase CdpA n=1 Tax=Saliniradius amylolyticus TaxID=2183582 RepID=A0A2S2DZQ4_9ALTE|nr:EAL domain-containing protein [Saliniradius amylolyticus]AWL10871.1 Cyclic di-GMP phosphodiesterase CdpA [Saliniradius amylolyticus]